MGRKGGGGGGSASQRRPSTLSPAIIHRRIDACKINHLSSYDIAEHLYSAYPDYKHFKLIPFRTKVEQILQHSRRRLNPQKSDDEEGAAAEEEEKSPEHRRKKLKQIDEREAKLLKRENDYVRRRREGGGFDGLSSSSSESEASVSTSEDAIYGEDVKPEVDLMKNMLRQGYGGSESKSMSNSKGKEEENLEVEDVRKEKAVSSLMTRGDGGGGKSSSELVQERESPPKGSVDEVKGKDGPRFKDFGGIKSVLDRLLIEVIVPLYRPELSQWLGVKPVSGILLHGPPGCGKTKLAHAIANEAGVPFYQISATEVVSGVSGASEENVRDLFSKAYRTAPSIVFIDEIDAIAAKRENLQREMERRIVTQLLTCMDESHRCVRSGDKDSNLDPEGKRPGYVLVIGATNRPDALDPAFRRGGRFDREIALGVPDENARLEILSVLTQDLRLSGDFDMAKIASSTPGFVGADLSALANKAGNLAMERSIHQRRQELSIEDGECDEEWWREPWPPEELEKLSITMSDFEEAVKLVQPSLRREGFSAIPNVKWEDVGGLDRVRKVFEHSIVRQIKHPKWCKRMGVDTSSGFLLYGPPGCGKTLIAKAVATEAGANFIHIKGPELLNKYVGESELHVRTIFTRARTCAPCILFFDEVDALTTKRGKEGGHIVERLLDQLMIELDGAEKRPGVFVIGATNRPEMMDDAVKRPGRFGKMLYVPLPSPEERGSILKALARKKPVDAAVDLLALGKSASCENFSGADLAALMNEAAMAALDEKLASSEKEPEFEDVTIKSVHFEQALRKVSPSVSAMQIQYYERLSQKSFQAA